MTCQHHPDSQQLLAFASGRLSFARQTAIQIHLNMCPHCASHVHQLESFGGDWLDKLEPQPLTHINAANVLDAIRKQTDSKPQPSTSDYSDIIHKAVRGETDQLNWHWRTKRFAELPLAANDDGLEVKLIYIKPGMKVPKHTHQGKEITVLLQGSFHDHLGHYRRGDYVVRDRNHEHSPQADSECICLAITDAPLKFTGTFGPVLNWLFN
ncbi:ChrR family anti-sigma-E factor [Pleionea sp. CnH1-48]|uniref:ChrR family anti-sigma-E factor n=1 Tax=Pleionea sp. CnH1-48 TaxID=2954494 RepID=UPI0020982EE9|nr:ChrR family anti-sigma-E factor [Pleionea sp. CnH1-48]MCO7226923.1 ChrR family anti-sigma-E factor [Pleionea sp. CnH1-48]